MGPLVRVVAESDSAEPVPAEGRPLPATALLEAIDRDGLVRQAWRIERWPVTIGRALDNDVVLTEAHVAAHHATLDVVAAEGDPAAPANSSSDCNPLTTSRALSRDCTPFSWFCAALAACCACSSCRLRLSIPAAICGSVTSRR